MTAHFSDNGPLYPSPPYRTSATGVVALSRVLYLGRSTATAEALRALLQNGAASNPTPGSHPARGQSARDAAHTSPPQLEIVTNQKAALRHVLAQPPALLLVETSSRPDSRLHFCQTLRARLPSMAIVAVVGGRERQYNFAFDAQVRTPVEPTEALAALRELRARTYQQALIRRGPITLDRAARRVHSPQGEFEMTPKQCALLELLMGSERVVSRAEIMRTIWETAYLDDTRTLDVHIHWLRALIEPDPANPVYLVTHRGVGYRFASPD